MNYFPFNGHNEKIYSLLLLVILSTGILFVSFDKVFPNLKSIGIYAQSVMQSHSNSSHTNSIATTSTSNTTATTTTTTGKVRTYYIAADEVPWNYAPFDKNLITGKPFDKTANIFVQNSSDRIGKTYLKAIYREYIDGNFTHLKPVPPQWQHLGILGPAIHAEVGDTIKVVFKNNAQYPFSIHPHGVFYLKNSEGAGYNDGNNINNNNSSSSSSNASVVDGDAVPPGKTYTYIWNVPERAGPGPNDPNSIVWAYHSHVNEVADTNAGLVGPIIITRHGEANPDGTPKGVDREFVTLFTIFNENKSPYLDQNIKKYIGNSTTVNTQDDEFIESNLKHSINGFVYGNLQGLNMKQGEHTRWYVMGMGTETDVHTPHWHGQTLLMDGMRTDMVELLPMSMKTLDMIPDDKGTWLFHCHVNDHIEAGMLSLFTVT
jgi:FtsP/CotA-like multicopper oxidase with cupredoxin domain